MAEPPTRWFRVHGAWLMLATIYHPKILNFIALTDQGKMGVDEAGHEMHCDLSSKLSLDES